MYNPKAVRLPGYRMKGGMSGFSVPAQRIMIRSGKLKVPISRTVGKGRSKDEDYNIWIPYPPHLVGKKLAEIRLFPVGDGKAIKIAFTYEDAAKKPATSSQEILGIDLGVNNLAACVSTTGTSFILDGRGLKSVNQWYNKEMARLQDLAARNGIKGMTNKQFRVLHNRNNRVQDYIYKSAKYILDFCIENGIGTVIVGVSEGWKQFVMFKKKDKQHFVGIPHTRFRKYLQYLLEKNGICYIEQEESFTSASSFLDNDPLPVYGDGQRIHFSGRRIKRGLYRTGKRILVNADTQAAANIIRKALKRMQNVPLGDKLDGLTRGVMTTPVRVCVIKKETTTRNRNTRFSRHKRPKRRPTNFVIPGSTF